MRNIKQLIMAIAMFTIAGTLTACGSLSHNIADDGSSAGQIVWPDVDDTIAMHKDGTWPTTQSLELVSAGMAKNQIMELIGAPHYNEGVWGVREWNYVFHLRDPETGIAHICQYKVLFDTDKLARSFYWKPESCNPARTGQSETVLTVSALFDFDQSDFDTIDPEGRAQLRQIVDPLKARVAAGDVIRIDGYAGPLGSADYNKSLSQKRAATVRAYLIGQGIPAAAIQARGHGVSRTVSHCEVETVAAAMACHAPDRRVEVVVEPGV